MGTRTTFMKYQEAFRFVFPTSHQVISITDQPSHWHIIRRDENDEIEFPKFSLVYIQS